MHIDTFTYMCYYLLPKAFSGIIPDFYTMSIKRFLVMILDKKLQSASISDMDLSLSTRKILVTLRRIT